MSITYNAGIGFPILGSTLPIGKGTATATAMPPISIGGELFGQAAVAVSIYCYVDSFCKFGGFTEIYLEERKGTNPWRRVGQKWFADDGKGGNVAVFQVYASPPFEVGPHVYQTRFAPHRPTAGTSTTGYVDQGWPPTSGHEYRTLIRIFDKNKMVRGTETGPELKYPSDF